MFKYLKLKILNYLIPRIKRQLDYYETKEIENKKNIILKKLQSTGYGCKLNGSNWTFIGSENVIIGNNVHFGNNIFIYGTGGLTIGDNTHISRNVTIYTANHNYLSSALPYDETSNYKPVVIGKNVWIGMNVSILPGIKIGDGAIIGMGSIVNRDVKTCEVVGNSSLFHIKFRDLIHYDKLELNKKYGSVNGKLLDNNELENFKSNYRINKNNKIIFILGTGRSGSKSIVEILNQNPINKAFHEDIKQLIRISSEFAYYPGNKDKLYFELYKIFETTIWQAKENQVLIHSDQRLWNLVPFLSEYFPNSKFIHLYREPISCVKSMFVRNWYSDNEYPQINKHDWAKYRLQADKTGIITTNEWKKYSSIEKCSWYWNFVNNSIYESLSIISDKRKMSLDISHIDNLLPKISCFVNQENFDYKLVKTNTIKDYHLKNSHIFSDKEYNKVIENYLKKHKNNFNIQFFN